MGNWSLFALPLSYCFPRCHYYEVPGHSELLCFTLSPSVLHRNLPTSCNTCTQSLTSFSSSLLGCHLPYKVLIDPPSKISSTLCSQDTCSSCHQHCLSGSRMFNLRICPHLWAVSSTEGPSMEISFLALSNTQNNI